jgi:hypothetical protein
MPKKNTPDDHGPHKLYRCDASQGCGNVYLYEDVKNGGCPHCGGRRCAYAVTITDKEAAYVKDRGYDLAANGWEHQESPNGD